MATQYWNGSAWATPKMKIWDGSRWADIAGGAKIKSIQHGISSLSKAYDSGGWTVNTIPISTVDPSKAYLIINKKIPDTYNAYREISGELSANSLVFTSQSYGSVRWSVIEFESGVSVQRGSFSNYDGYTDITISTVDTNKSFSLVTAHNKATYNTYYPKGSPQSYFKSGTSLSISADGVTNPTIKWQVVSFE